MPLSTASINWIRSFVPMLIKSTSSPNSSAITATDGISSIMPSVSGSPNFNPSFFNSLEQSFISSLVLLTSFNEVTIGIINFIFLRVLALKAALICALNTFGLSKRNLIPLHPIKGLGSLTSCGRNLSPPTSNALMTIFSG
ncbi:MAG TPA: hypothetical protein VHO28_08850, partial [Ignavibacteriales bacterium]|nr:hypothetical protein [Ignavibacteriales bacterium]